VDRRHCACSLCSHDRARDLSPRLKPFHCLLAIFGGGEEVAVLAMFHSQENLPLGRAVAVELIRDDDAPDGRQLFLVSPALHPIVEHLAVSIDRAPQT
jgi:hypothetical protein